MAHQRYVKQLGWFDGFFTVMTDPFGTMEHFILERPTPPYLLRTLALLVVVLCGPVLFIQYRYDIEPPQIELTYAWILAFIFTGLFFICFNILFLRLLGVKAPVIKIVAVVIYALAPIIPIFLAYYVANIIVIGKLSFTTYLMTGQRASGDWFITLFPGFWFVAKALCFIVLIQGTRMLGHMSTLTGTLSAICALFLVYGAFFLACTIVEAIFPGASVTVYRWVSTFGVIPNS